MPDTTNIMRVIPFNVTKAVFATLMVASAMLAVLLATQQPAQAHGTGLPYHASGGPTCCTSGGQLYILAKVPNQMYSWAGTTRLETVFWSPDLQYWDGSSWRPYDTSKPWYRAETNVYGLRDTVNDNYDSYWTNTANEFPVLKGNGPVFGPLPRGWSFRVKEYYNWSYSGYTHVMYPYFTNTGQSYCRLI
jgi:hypothetical protein